MVLTAVVLVDELGIRHDVNGGNAMKLDGPLFLCTRNSSGDTDRTLNGRLTQLGIFDQALNASQIQALYGQVVP